MSDLDRIYGFQPVREALRHRPQRVVRVRITAAPGHRRQEIEALCARHGVATGGLAANDRTRVDATAVHNGFVAEVRPMAAAPRAGDPELVVIAEDIQDPRNLGALLRVCECAGVGRVLIRDRGSAPISPAASKTAAGAVEWLEIQRVTNTAMELERLKKDGYWVYGAAPEGQLVWDVDLKGRVVLVIGGEARGLRRRTRTLCDRLVALPVRGHIASLNLATAASALLYESLRQRRA